MPSLHLMSIGRHSCGRTIIRLLKARYRGTVLCGSGLNTFVWFCVADRFYMQSAISRAINFDTSDNNACQPPSIREDIRYDGCIDVGGDVGV